MHSIRTPDRGRARSRVTAIVEPNPSGHRFQWVSHIARAAVARGDTVLLLTTKGASTTQAYRNFLGDLPLTVLERFGGIELPVESVLAALVDLHREVRLDEYVIPEADHLLKRWWLLAPRELRGRRAPKGILVYARFPSRVHLRDREAVQHRIVKTGLAALAQATGAARRVVALVGRDELEPGRVVKRVRDPAICTAHARDRARLRRRYDLPQDRRLVSILGRIELRKSVPLVFDAVLRAGDDVDLLLAGELFDDVRAWLDERTPDELARIHGRFGFLTEEDIDGYTAASDICATVHLNKGPSGIMGKAQVAGVPVLSAGSKIRSTEATATGGIDTAMTAPALAEGIRTLLARGGEPLPVDPTLPTAEEFGAVVLGTAPRVRTSAPRRAARIPVA
jgi:glycosyltransferase involved in cell wall biosynthesis